jgi:hypothetical protein
VGIPATFDLTLDSSIFRISTGDEDGNVSNFVFSGDADSICTTQANF